MAEADANRAAFQCSGAFMCQRSAVQTGTDGNPLSGKMPGDLLAILTAHEADGAALMRAGKDTVTHVLQRLRAGSCLLPLPAEDLLDTGFVQIGEAGSQACDAGNVQRAAFQSFRKICWLSEILGVTPRSALDNAVMAITFTTY